MRSILSRASFALGLVVAMLVVAAPAFASVVHQVAHLSHTLTVSLVVAGPSVVLQATTINSQLMSLADWAKRRDPSGKIGQIVELLNQTNAILDDSLWKEGNLTTGDRVTMRTGLPAVAYRLLNAGVPRGKSTTSQVDEQCALLEGRGSVDKDIADLEGDLNAFRLSESQPFMEAMNQQMAQTMFYGNATVQPESFTGLSARYSTLSGAKNAQNILDGGGTGSNNCSIWLVGWGENTFSGVFPKGTAAGLQHFDLGEGDEFDANQNRYRAYMDRWVWKAGVRLKDWRFVVRICNINVANLVSNTSAADLITLMSRAIDRIPNPGMAKLAFYAGRTPKSILRVQALTKSTNALAVEPGLTQFGKAGASELTFLGIPVRTVDQLLETEARVV